MEKSWNWLVVVALVTLIAIHEGYRAEASCFSVDMMLEDYPTQPHRTAFHFQPPKNWMNDPNGPMYYKGVYHLFYQYNPNVAEWGDGVLSWGHSASQNLVDWVHLEHALNPTHPFDINGCWSGSATVLPDGTPAILYTGSDSENRQVQNLAVPKNASDPYLREWIKSDHNPLMNPVDYGIGINDFRDPTTAWLGPNGKWRLIIGTEINGFGTALMFQSEDFVTWTKIHKPLYSSNKTKMWECVDMYPVSVNGANGLDTYALGEKQPNLQAVKHVLKASFNNQDSYVIGSYESETDEFFADIDFLENNVDLRYDYGMYFGAKTFYDSAQRRRVNWAWVPEADSKTDGLNKGWSGLMSLPRSILLGQGGEQLLQWPVREIERLRGEEVRVQNVDIKEGSVFEITGITAAQADVEVSFHLPNLDDAELLHRESHDPKLLCRKKNTLAGGKFGPFGLLVLASNNLTEHTAVFFRIYKRSDKFVVLMCSDQSRSSLREEVGKSVFGEEVDKSVFGAFVDFDPTQNLSLRSLIDHSIIESFQGGGKTCITARVYPQLAVGNKAHLHVFNYGTETVEISNLRAWSMEVAQLIPLHEIEGKSQI